MKKQIINQYEAIKKLKEKQDISLFTIEFNNEPIEAIDAILLGKNNIDVPEDLIYYNDDDIDYSDIPPLTDEELKQMKPVIFIPPHIPFAKEVKDYLLNSKLDFMELISDLLEKYYYENIKGK